MAKNAGVDRQILGLTREQYNSHPSLRHLHGILRLNLNHPDAKIRLTELAREEDLTGIARADFFQYGALWDCSTFSLAHGGKLSASAADLANTQTIFTNALVAGERIRRELGRSLASVEELARVSFASLENPSAKCATPSVTIAKSFRPKEILAFVGPANAYMAAMGATTYSVYNSIPNKFSGYDANDLGLEVGQFLAFSVKAKAMPAFGMGRPNAALIRTGEYLDDLEVKSETAVIPLTTFAASGLLASAILLVSLTAGTISRVGVLALRRVSAAVNRDKLSKLVFTFCACVISLFLVFIMLFSLLLDALWWVLFA